MSDGAAAAGVLLTVAYDGAPYAGFVEQRAQPTVAGELRRALHHLDPTIGRLRVASRTDAGVHATDQRVAFDTALQIPPKGWALGAARYLPPSIAILSAAEVPVRFEPRFEARAKTYRYLVHGSQTPNPLLAHRAWRTVDLDLSASLEILRTELRALHGTHRFAAFRSTRDKRDHIERTITHTAAERSSEWPDVVCVEISGDGFLHHMVRIAVGTVVDVARGRLAPGAVTRALASGDRRDAGITAPPDGLYLRRVELANEGSARWP
ncbi:MAG: tRNA pseudouridine(38-40) synthase TruA [Deltaproteobacteria bacterium]|jgi:tRNA pseudouridine38-40 synthase|nr:tRNA pseudouridine(38-40) synthase TruA [Deltaproteobacteria bacterium]MBW2537850.1 tRNA pseudouridine(38-40) synthase TruA [Deltaproteobacteria bacterium]